MGCPGLEPGTNRLKAEYSTIELATLKRYRGIEPLASVWKTEVLPLYEYRDGFTNEFYVGGSLLSSVCDKQGYKEEALQSPSPLVSGALQALLMRQAASSYLVSLRNPVLRMDLKQRLAPCLPGVSFLYKPEKERLL